MSADQDHWPLLSISSFNIFMSALPRRYSKTEYPHVLYEIIVQFVLRQPSSHTLGRDIRLVEEANHSMFEDQWEAVWQSWMLWYCKIMTASVKTHPIDQWLVRYSKFCRIVCRTHPSGISCEDMERERNNINRFTTLSNHVIEFGIDQRCSKSQCLIQVR